MVGVEGAQRTDPQQPTVLTAAEEGDVGPGQPVEVQGVHVLGGTVLVGEGQVAFEQGHDVGGARVIEGDVGHRQLPARPRRWGVSLSVRNRRFPERPTSTRLMHV